MKKRIAYYVLMVLLAMAFVACGEDEGGTTGTTGSTVNFTVSFDSQGGSAVTNQTVASNGLAVEPVAPTKEGRVFGGWYKEASGTTAWVFGSDTVTANVTLYAKWVFTVSFDSQGGSAVTNQTVASNGLATAPVAPTKTGYAFGGWYRESSSTTAWVFESDTVTANVTLYAKWNIAYTVTYDSQSGTSVDPQQVVQGSLTTQPSPQPTRTGYTFGGWYRESSCTTAWVFGSDTVTANVTLFAKWVFNTQSWKTITSSSDGTKLVAAAWTGQIYTSMDAGTNWSARDTNRFWWDITSSSDGTKLAAAVYYSGQIYTSTDSGVTWVTYGSNMDWEGIAGSSDGTKLAAVASGGQIYTSTDSGVNWTARDSSRNWKAIASSSDGTKLAAAVYNGQIYTSTDSGVTWTPRASNRSWHSITSSSDGTKLVAVVWNGQIYTSTDSGVNWTARDSNRSWQIVRSSSDGTKLVAAVWNGQIYTSADSGVNWTARDSTRNWNGVASSSDGTRLAAVASGGRIYISTDSGVTWTPGF